jgi:hypothetical protein
MDEDRQCCAWERDLKLVVIERTAGLETCKGSLLFALIGSSPR